MSPRPPRSAPPPVTPSAHGRRLLLALLFWGAIHAATWVALRPPAPRADDASPRAFSAVRAAVVLDALGRDVGPRPTGSRAAALVRSRIEERLRRLGLAPTVQEVYACGPEASCATVRNVVVRRDGSSDAPAVLLVAHYDSVAAGPGVSDDLAGVAALLELARIAVEERRPRRTLLFLFTDGEEDGLIGAAGFAAYHPWMDEVGVVLNLEARGVSGPSFLFETGPDDYWLVDLYAGRVPHPTFTSSSVEIYRRMPNDSDFSVFRGRGLAGLNFAFIGDVFAYHTPLDDREHLSLASLQQQGDQVLAVLQELEGLEARRGSTGRGDAVGFTLFGSWLFIYAAGLAPWLGLAAVLGILWGTQRAVVRGRLAWGAVAGGVALVPVLVVAAVAVGFGITELLALGSGAASPWHATPSPTRVAQVGAVAAATCLLAPPAARAVGTLALAHGAWVLWGMGALFLGFFVPGVSYLVAVPALGMALLGNTMRLEDGLEGRLARVALVVLAVGVALWAPVQLGLAQAFGPGASPVLTAPLALLATLVLPLVALAPPVLVRSLGALGLACVAFGGAMVLVLPHQSVRVPARLNLVYAQGPVDGETPEDRVTQWQAWTFGAALPPELRSAATFDSGERDLEPSWWGLRCHRAPTASLGLPAPTFTLAAQELDGSGRRHVRGRLRSPLGAHRTTLSVEPGWVLESLRAEGVAVPLGDAGEEDPARATFVEAGEAGVELELVLAPQIYSRSLPTNEVGDVGEFQVSTSPVLLLVDRALGLPEAGRFLADARPEAFVPSHLGDGRMVAARVVLDAD